MAGSSISTPGSAALLRERDAALAERDAFPFPERHRLAKLPDTQFRPLHIEQQTDAPPGLPLGRAHRVQIRLCLAQRCVR